MSLTLEEFAPDRPGITQLFDLCETLMGMKLEALRTDEDLSDTVLRTLALIVYVARSIDEDNQHALSNEGKKLYGLAAARFESLKRKAGVK